MFANRRRKERLANTLCILNKLLETKKFIIDDQFTLADICVATQLLSVLGKDENKPFSKLQVQISYLSPSNCRTYFIEKILKQTTLSQMFKQLVGTPRRFYVET